jgi:hypothetical protein
MIRWVLAATLIAVAAFMPAAANAADTDDDDEPGAYNNPQKKAQQQPPPGQNYQDDDDDDKAPPPSKKFSGPPPAYKQPGMPPPGKNCVRSEQVRQALTDMGWQDFQGGRQQGDMVVMNARRRNGRQFELTLHRCSGQIVEVRPLEGRPNAGPYAFNRPYDNDRYDRYDGPRGPYGYDDRWRDQPYGYGPRRWWWRDY